MLVKSALEVIGDVDEATSPSKSRSARGNASCLLRPLHPLALLLAAHLLITYSYLYRTFAARAFGLY